MAKSKQSLLSFLGNFVAAVAIVAGSRLSERLHPAPRATSPVDILGVTVDPLTTEQVIRRCEEFIKSGQPHHLFTADACGIMQMQEDAELRDIVRQADLVTADGFGVVVAAHLRGINLPERVSGVDLVEKLSVLAARNGYRVFYFGAADGVALAAANALKRDNPDLCIAGARHGFFTTEDEAGVVREIAAAKPDVLFVALGIPKQERFIRQHYHELGVPVMIGIGGSFDVISGQLARAPKWMQRCGLEWLFRLYQEPARLPRMTILPTFVVKAWRNRN